MKLKQNAKNVLPIEEIKLILKEMTMPRFNGELGYDEDRFVLIKKVWDEIEKYEESI